MFFDRFKQLCEMRGISIYKAATDVGLNRAAANKWKAGSIPGGQTLAKLADYFGVTGDYLLGKTSDVLEEVDVAFYGDYRELSEADREVIRNMVHLMRRKRLEEQK